MQAEPTTGAPGAVVPGVTEWSGPAGLERLRSRLRLVAPDPSAFRARAQVLAEQELTLVEWRSTPLTAHWSPGLGDQWLCLTVLLGGEARWATDTSRWHGAGRGVSVLRCAEGVRFELPRGAHLRSLLLPIGALPRQLRSCRLLREGALPPTRLVHAFAAVLQEGFGDALELGRVPPGLPLALRGLAAGVLEEAGSEDVPYDGPLREQILSYVDRHLDDPRLGPQSIADALGISLRWVHASFSGQGTTLARHIRGRRVEAVARHVLAERERPRLHLLAAMFGFAGRDQLTRAFSARYGVGVGAYWEANAGGGAGVSSGA